MSANGELRTSELTLIQADLYLSVKTARAWNRLKAAAKSRHGRTIAAARKAGAYRSRAVQKAMQKAWDSRSATVMATWNMDPASKVRPADPGESPHGWGTTVDIVGTPIDATFVKLAREYGFSFSFGTSDPRHAVHDGKTATSPVLAPATVRKVVYTVQSGDSLSKIAGRYRTTWQHLLTLNPSIHDANLIRVGQKVRVA